MTKITSKPFIKWAGGKGKLLSTLDRNLPQDFIERHDVTYIEPFVGAGAMLFHMIEKHPNINRVIINDINPALINCYRCIKDHHEALIDMLRSIHNYYHEQPTQDERKELYYGYRQEYNDIPVPKRNTIRAAALFMTLNKTCFNGLYRENGHGGFNVPFGKYANPTICNEELIINAHNALQNVEILNGNYSDVLRLVNWDEFNFFYFDPPYRPLLGSKNFNQYTKDAFNDREQVALRDFCNEISTHGAQFMLSNSDSEIEPGVNYFEEIYEGYNIQRIYAPRTINAFVPGVEKATEVLIKNY